MNIPWNSVKSNIFRLRNEKHIHSQIKCDFKEPEHLNHLSVSFFEWYEQKLGVDTNIVILIVLSVNRP